MRVETPYFDPRICANLVMSDRTKSVETSRFAVVRSRPRAQAWDTIRGEARGILGGARSGFGLCRRRRRSRPLAAGAGKLARSAHAYRAARSLCTRHAYAGSADTSVGAPGGSRTSSRRGGAPRAADRSDAQNAHRLAERTGRG